MVGGIANPPGFPIVSNGTQSSARAQTPNARDALAQSKSNTSVTLDTEAGYDYALAAAQRETTDARGAIDLAVATARDGRSLLADARDIAARAAAPDTPDAARQAQDVAFRDLIQQFGRLIDQAIRDGSTLLEGKELAIAADPELTQSASVDGLDLRLATRPSGADVVQIGAGASVADPASAADSVRRLDETVRRIDDGVRRLSDAGEGLGGHERILSALSTALRETLSVDLTADGARLMALQVRQGLSGVSESIANVRPDGLLAHFRS
jgi:flagellin